MSPFRVALIAAAISAAATVSVAFIGPLFERWLDRHGAPTDSGGAKPQAASEPRFSAGQLSACADIVEATDEMMMSCQAYVASADGDLNVQGLSQTSNRTRQAFAYCTTSANTFFETARRRSMGLPDDINERVADLIGASQRFNQAIIFTPENRMSDAIVTGLNEVRERQGELRRSCRTEAGVQ